MLEERIYQDYLDALRAKNKGKYQFLSFIRAEIKNFAIHLRKDKLDDSQVLAVLNKQKKHLQETLDSGALLERRDIIDSANNEMSVLAQYL
ncbi:MAG: GatB/YqeY domain-containing protein, partial [Candidatus Omnitrophota bacterium]